MARAAPGINSLMNLKLHIQQLDKTGPVCTTVPE